MSRNRDRSADTPPASNEHRRTSEARLGVELNFEQRPPSRTDAEHARVPRPDDSTWAADDALMRCYNG